MSAGIARAFWIAAPGCGEIRAEQLPPPGEGELLVRAMFSGISRGTEALVFHGRVPPSEYARMRAPFQTGDWPGPVKYGYASVGRVQQGPPAWQDRTVFVLYPHQTHYVVPVDSVYLVPEDVPAERAVLAANLETAINGVWDASIHPGDRVAVIGAGTIGCLVARLAARMPGCEVELVDLNPRRGDLARALGAAFATPDTARADADVVVHASGAASGLDLALRLAGFESTVVEMSWYGNQMVSVSLGAAFHSRRLTLKSSQVGSVSGAQRSRWDSRRRMQLALSLLNDPALDSLITGESNFDALPQVMDTLAQMAGDTVCHRIKYSGA